MSGGHAGTAPEGRRRPQKAGVQTSMRALCLLSCCFSLSAAFYFHTGEREEKCVIEDIPSDTLITGSFKTQQWDVGRHDFLESAPGLGMFVTVTTYDGEVLLSKLYGSQGTFHFTSHSPGEHIICLESNSTRLVSFGGSKLRVHLDILVGEHDLDAAIAQAKDKVKEVSFKLQHLMEQVEQILREQHYQRVSHPALTVSAGQGARSPRAEPEQAARGPALIRPLPQAREESFRATSEDTHGGVLRWALAQTLLLLAVGLFQMQHLKGFFIAKKLV
ncbi:Transmembrane emp24 domain-containing protein 11 [Galemys pyrenaicus]|uniref:Transmembrane emp24 domain-containing protein 11 n=1 Tax=Galemys pyrenaicus TaxID=202257 RepID=A0A8J5ZWX9_GALPY|nr:Transmembrane emp24 domain-containing protein 11 [Galemys pyrenaicus]